MTPALERAAALLRADRRPRAGELRPARGWLDLAPDAAPPVTGAVQRLMVGRAVPRVYARWWRPAWGRVLLGPWGPSMAEELRLAAALLELRPGDAVLDLACGTGAFTRSFAAAVGELGLALGADASPAMLDRAVAETPAQLAGTVGYLRADALDLPLRDASVDAVCCFAALHLMADPWRALDEMRRVLTPGGRLALLTSSRAAGGARRAVEALAGPLSGMRLFERDEVRAALERRGFTDVAVRLAGAAQIVGARR
ncbi:MAG TPA: methyltransferase domain-containing protein [Solirubrobacteraceae bacterium]|nr:methyltransferase domain-containing protein [Solirubrobacteraceae bacterium]